MGNTPISRLPHRREILFFTAGVFFSFFFFLHLLFFSLFFSFLNLKLETDSSASEVQLILHLSKRNHVEAILDLGDVYLRNHSDCQADRITCEDRSAPNGYV